uniref:hypothetical protein n=1 Tax=Xanthobacter wiegelii TaxID=3119913 RepID=UPI00372D07F9
MLYPLDEVLLLTFCAVLCGADGWVSVAPVRQAEARFSAPLPALCERHAEP